MKLILITISILLTMNAHSSEYHKDLVQNITNVTVAQSSGIAMVMGAASIDCARSTQRWQMGAGLGSYNDSTALAVGGCKRFNETMIKLTGSKDGKNTAYSASVMWTLN